MISHLHRKHVSDVQAGPSILHCVPSGSATGYHWKKAWLHLYNLSLDILTLTKSPQSLFFFRLNYPCSCLLHPHALCWTLSTISISYPSVLYWESLNCTQAARMSWQMLMKKESSPSTCWQLFAYCNPRIPFAFLGMRAHCWFLFQLVFPNFSPGRSLPNSFSSRQPQTYIIAWGCSLPGVQFPLLNSTDFLLANFSSPLRSFQT